MSGLLKTIGCIILASGAVCLVILIIACMIDYFDGKKGCCGKLSFERFLRLYAIAPEHWRLGSTWVTYDKFGRRSSFHYIPGTDVSESHYYFTIIDTIRYIMWNRQNEKDEETQRNNKILETDILYWQDDIKRYCEEHNIPIKKEENSA